MDRLASPLANAIAQAITTLVPAPATPDPSLGDILHGQDEQVLSERLVSRLAGRPF